MSNECVVLWNIAFPLSMEERTCVSSAGLFNLITNLRLDKRRASSVFNLVSRSARDDGNPCRAFSDWFVLQEYTSLNKDSHILRSLYFNVTIPAAFLFVLATSGFCRDLCFLVIGCDTTECWALVRATANQTRPQEMCEGTELDQLQRKTKGEDNTSYAATIGSVVRKQFLLPQSYKIHNKMRYIKKHGVTGDGV